jgi:flagellar basal-body rod protein FlgF
MARTVQSLLQIAALGSVRPSDRTWESIAMENYTLVALSGQIALKRKLDVIANNVANINTEGYKRVAVEFETTNMPKASTTLFPKRDRANDFVREQGTVTDFSAGSVELTGNDLDAAINSNDTFFTVSTPEGERYTRAGSFQLDSTGRLVTSDGKPVLGQGGEIVFSPNETNIAIAGDGTISTSVGNKDKLKFAKFDDTSVLSQVGENLYSAAAAPTVPVYADVKQGALERSNVSGVEEMTRLIDVQRSYERLISMMRQQNELNSKAIDRLGSMTA